MMAMSSPGEIVGTFRFVGKGTGARFDSDFLLFGSTHHLSLTKIALLSLQHPFHIPPAVEHSYDLERGFRTVDDQVLIKREKEYRRIGEVGSAMSLTGHFGQCLKCI